MSLMSVVVDSWLLRKFSCSCVRDFFGPKYSFRTAFCGWQGPFGGARIRQPVHDRHLWLGERALGLGGIGEDAQRLLISDRPAVLIDRRDDETIRARPAAAAGPLPLLPGLRQ